MTPTRCKVTGGFRLYYDCFIDFCLSVTRQYHGSRRSAFMILGWGSPRAVGNWLRKRSKDLFFSLAVGTRAVEESNLGTRTAALINAKFIKMGS